MENLFGIMFTVVPILVFGGIIFTFVIMFSPKARGKIMSKQMEAAKHMLNESKGSLSDLANTALSVKKNILDENEDTLREMARKEANIEKEGIEIKARAIKDGLTNNSTYCKHCGASIDNDSTFCRFCGKKQ